MKFIIPFLILVLSACSHSEKHTDVMRLIEQAAEVAPEGVEGEFFVHIQATGQQKLHVFLNTQLDYRDRRNLTIDIAPKAVKQLYEIYDESPHTYLLDKNIIVKGLAQQVKIYIFVDGKKLSKYYYQTHIRVNSPEQIVVVDK